MQTHDPIFLLKTWITDEKEKGAPDPNHAILSTATKDAIPHGRVIAIREINDRDFLFFTQSGSRKVQEFEKGKVSLTFWFELFEREVMIDGTIQAICEKENERYWNSYSDFSKIRFHTYAPTSSKTIPNKKVLEDRKKIITKQFENKTIPMSEYYCGFRIIPSRMVFYTYRTDELSDVIAYDWIQEQWAMTYLSP